MLDASGAPLGDATNLASGPNELTRIGVADAGDGGFHVLYQIAEQSPLSNTSTINAQRVGAGGAPDGTPVALVRRRLAGLLASSGAYAPSAGPEFCVSGGADGHYVVSYQLSADTSIEAHAQAR